MAGPAVMLGYLDDPKATGETLKGHADGRTWLHTGDLGRRDVDGFFYFTVRAKRMIESSGFNVYPAQVESVLCQHPLVAEVCVIGVPDEAQDQCAVAENSWTRLLRYAASYLSSSRSDQRLAADHLGGAPAWCLHRGQRSARANRISSGGTPGARP